MEDAMLDFVGTVATAALMVFVVGTFAVCMDAARGAKLAFLAGAGVWIGFCAAAGMAGWLAIARPVPVIGLFVAAPLAAAAVAAMSPAARAAILSVPMPVMIGLNMGRVLAVLFLLLAAQGRLGGPFPYFAAGGDIITGVLALPIMLRAAASPARHRTAIAAWNLFGTADLINAITFGVTSAENALQIFSATPGSAAMQDVPWSFVPSVLVPFYLIMHAIIWAQLRRPART
jgi:hypothetical protein